MPRVSHLKDLETRLAIEVLVRFYQQVMRILIHPLVTILCFLRFQYHPQGLR